MKEEKFFTLDPTDHITNKIDRERLIEKAYPKAQALIEKYSIKEEDLRENIYGDRVDDDLKEVAKKEELFSRETNKINIENNKLSEIFNAIILEQFEKNNWMGQEAFTTGTAKYEIGRAHV